MRMSFPICRDDEKSRNQYLTGRTLALLHRKPNDAPPMLEDFDSMEVVRKTHSLSHSPLFEKERERGPLGHTHSPILLFLHTHSLFLPPKKVFESRVYSCTGAELFITRVHQIHYHHNRARASAHDEWTFVYNPTIGMELSRSRLLEPGSSRHSPKEPSCCTHDMLL